MARYLDGEPVQAHRESAAERAGRFFRKYQTAIVLVLTYLLIRLLFLAARGLLKESGHPGNRSRSLLSTRRYRVNKPVLGLILGGVLGALDGLTALLSAPEVKPEIMTIVAGSTGKGLLAGLLIGFISRKVNDLTASIVSGCWWPRCWPCRSPSTSIPPPASGTSGRS